MKLALVNNSESTFDVPSSVGQALVASGVARCLSRNYDAAWRTFIRGGRRSLTGQEVRALGTPASGSFTVPDFFIDRLKHEISSKMALHCYNEIWASLTETEALTSLGVPRASKLADIGVLTDEPEPLPPLIEMLPPVEKYSSGLLRLPCERVQSPTFDLESALASFFSDAFVNEIKRQTGDNERDVWSQPLKAKGIVRLCPSFSVFRLDERFADFGEVAFVAFGHIGKKLAVYKS